MDWAEDRKVREAARALAERYPETYAGLEDSPYGVTYNETDKTMRVKFRHPYRAAYISVVFIRNVETGEYHPYTY